jgi:TonB family protein
MRVPAIVALSVLACATCIAEDIGRCPSDIPPIASVPKSVAPASPDPDKKYAGSVVVITVVSDTGYVCSTRVARGINKELNKKAEEAVRHWRFKPASKDGHPVPVAVAVEVHFWMNGKGEISTAPPSPPASASGEQTEAKPNE